MPKYLEIAGQANELALALVKLVPEADRPRAAEMVARLVNLGIRCSPRGVHHTVRLNAVVRACRELPVKVTMREVTDVKTGRKYNALTTQQLGGVESYELADASDD